MKKPLREILAGMTFQEKISYIWEYYKYFIIGIGLFLILLIYTIVSVMNQKDDVLNIILITRYADTEQIKALRETLTENLLTEEEQESSRIIIQPISPGTDIQAGMERQKFVAELTAGVVDVIIADTEFFEQLNFKDQLLALQKFDEFSELNIPEDKFYRASDNENDITGIDVTDIPLFEGLFYEEGERIFCSPSNTKNTRYIFRFIEFLEGYYE